ncbi:MAG: DUF971 domain-containing protein [bacterium]|nr:DUF971 domain-containing protein [bacterium]
MNPKIRPLSIRRQGDDELLIEWSDGETRLYTARELRKACPCAVCTREKPPADPTALPVLSQKDLEPLRIAQMSPQGYYGYLIGFSDGHGTGTYSLPYLKQLGTPISPSES